MPFELDDLGTGRRYSKDVAQCTGNLVIPITLPMIIGPDTALIGATVTLTAYAVSLLADSTLLTFDWTLPNGTVVSKPAARSRSTITVPITGAAGDRLTVTVAATDSQGNRSVIDTHDITVAAPLAPIVSTLATNIPVSIGVGETATGLSIHGATDPSGGTVSYALTMPLGLTASKTTGLVDNEEFSVTAAEDASTTSGAVITIRVTTSNGGNASVTRTVAIVITPTLPVDIDTVFAVNTYAGNVNSQVVVTGLNQLSKGGFNWTKNRTLTDNHQLSPDISDPYDLNMWDGTYFTTTPDITNLNKYISTYTVPKPILSMSNGSYTLNGNVGNRFNAANSSYAAWSFCKSPRFLDIITFAMEGSLETTVAHNLKCAVGAVIVFEHSGLSGPVMWHRSVPDKYVQLHSTTGFATGTLVKSSDTRRITFAAHNTALPNAGVLQDGKTYTAYLFGHDTASDSVIYCGKGSGGNGESMTGQWEPQWALQTLIEGGDVRVVDTTRGWSAGDTSVCSKVNTPAGDSRSNYGNPTATGFVGAFPEQTASLETVYIAIRKGAKVIIPSEPLVRYKVLGTSGTGTWTVPPEATNLLTFTGNGGPGVAEQSGTRGVEEAYELTAGYYKTVETSAGHYEQQLLAAGYYRQEVKVEGHFEQGAMLTPGEWKQDYTNGGWHYENQQVCGDVPVLVVAEYWEQVPGYWETNEDGSQYWLQPNPIFHAAKYKEEYRCEYLDRMVDNPPIWVEPTYEQTWVPTTYTQVWVEPTYTQVWVPPGTSQEWVPPVYGTRTVTVPYTIPGVNGADTTAYWGNGAISYDTASSGKRVKFAGNLSTVPGTPAPSTVAIAAPTPGTVISFTINGYLKVEW